MVSVLLRSLYGATAVMAVPRGNGGAAAISLRLVQLAVALRKF